VLPILAGKYSMGLGQVPGDESKHLMTRKAAVEVLVNTFQNEGAARVRLR
jgi:hypothetical protein